jgi:hypothetical protein
MKNFRVRFKCAFCERWRGHTLLAGFLGKLRPACVDCWSRWERTMNHGGRERWTPADMTDELRAVACM